MGEETTNIVDERMNNKFSISFKDGQMASNGKRRILGLLWEGRGEMREN